MHIILSLLMMLPQISEPFIATMLWFNYSNNTVNKLGNI